MERYLWTLACLCFTPLVVLPYGDRAAIAQSATAGWKKCTGRNIELSLPKSFVGGDLQKDIEAIVQRLEATDANLAESIRRNRGLFVLYCFDTVKGKSGFVSNVNATTEKVPPNITLNAYLDAVTRQLPQQFRITSRKLVKLPQYQAGRIVTEFTLGKSRGKQLIYVIKEGATVWSVTYSTAVNEFDSRLPVFQKSIETLRIRS